MTDDRTLYDKVADELGRLPDLDDLDPLAVAHSLRFRKLSTKYPHRVAEAYGGDLARAAQGRSEEGRDASQQA